MVKYKSKSLKSTALIIAIAAALIAAASFLGLGTMSSAVRVGYVSTDGLRSWTASYSMLDGKLKHTIRPKDTQGTIHAEVVTESGSISIEMEDADGRVIFDEDNIATSSFDVKISGKVVIRIEADKHKGSFRIEATE